MTDGEVDAKRDLEELQFILWGEVCVNETFKRWSQGFIFSKSEPTALLQRSGGPCAVLAPVQAYMLKYIINSIQPDELKKITKDEQESLLIRALVDILMQCTKRTQNPVITLVYREVKIAVKDEIVQVPSIHSPYKYDIFNETDLESIPVASTSKQEQATTEQMVTNDIEFALIDLPGVPHLLDITNKTIDNEPEQISCNLKKQSVCAANRAANTTNANADCQISTKDISIIDACEPKVANSPQLITITDSDSDNIIIDECVEALEPTYSTSHQHQVQHNEEVIEMEVKTTNPTGSNLTNNVWDPNVDDIIVISSDSDNDQLQLRETPSMLFHRSLRLAHFHTQSEVEAFLRLHIDQLRDEYGILLFSYSVLMTKGVEDLKSEICDLSDPLIHEVYGYGSQSLVNLMLTGRAVQYVWDNDQDVGGLTLKGIDQQSDIGFVTLMEHMRYCTVGMFYKNPKYPIWVLGSETHLTVAFSFDMRLVSVEQPWETARRVFRRYDPDGSNFIPFGLLQDLLQSLGLVSDPEYVEVMRQKLDSENLGIVLLSNFLDEFYPDMKSLVPETFTVWHYNGLAGSHYNNIVQYVKGHAVLLESDIKAGSDVDLVLTCLQTKWPNVEIQWETPNHKPPSLN